MMRNDDDDLASVIETLRKSGYTLDLNVNSSQLRPQDLQIDLVYRFEAINDQEDGAILYAISSRKGTEKGLLVNGYGIYSNETVNDFVEKIARPPYSNPVAPPDLFH